MDAAQNRRQLLNKLDGRELPARCSLQEQALLLAQDQNFSPENPFLCSILTHFLLLFTCSVMSDSFQPRGLQHSRLPCPPPSPGVCLNSCPLSWWCHPAISSLLPLSPFVFSLSQRQGLFQWVSSLHQVAKVLGLQLQQQSSQWIFMVGFL